MKDRKNDPLEGIPLCSMSEPVVGECGKTGSWRIRKPILNPEQCLLVRAKKSCYLCWLYCPEGVIARQSPPVIDYDYCKGCGICAQECPSGAIRMVDENED